MSHQCCEECGSRKPDVDLVADPFAKEVNNEIWLRWLCEPCIQSRADEA